VITTTLVVPTTSAKVRVKFAHTRALIFDEAGVSL